MVGDLVVWSRVWNQQALPHQQVGLVHLNKVGLEAKTKLTHILPLGEILQLRPNYQQRENMFKTTWMSLKDLPAAFLRSPSSFCSLLVAAILPCYNSYQLSGNQK